MWLLDLNPIQIRSNGKIYQMSSNPAVNIRYSVHLDGLGSGWTGIESLDVDKPHGLDYRQLNHLAIAVRKRMGYEHVTFADSTVGGIHKPGGAAILAIEDGTATILADGTLKGHGLAWDNTSRIWCSTAAAGASTTGDWTLVLIHPDKQWAGGDITWTGGHEFDASIDITGNVAVDGDVTMDGTLVVDGTGSAFGGGTGIELYYDPTAFVGAESMTLPNGCIIKQGTTSIATDATVTFTAAFPNDIANAWGTLAGGTSWTAPIRIHDISKSKIEIALQGVATRDVNWIAIGY